MPKPITYIVIVLVLIVLVVGSLLAFYFQSNVKKESVHLLWKYKTEGNVFSTPQIYKGRIYFGTCGIDSYLYALNVTDGELIWRFKTNKSIVSDPCIWNDRVYLTSYDTYLYALDADTGNLVWKFKTEAVIESSPIVYQGIVFFGSDDNRVYALNASTGELEWKHVATSPYSAEGASSGIVPGSPSAYEGIVYIGSLYRAFTFVNGSSEYRTSGCMHGLNATTGELIWRFDVREIPEPRFDVGGLPEPRHPQVYNGILYFGSWDHNIYAVNAKTGKLVWSYLTNGIISQSAPRVYDNIVCVGSCDSYIYALDAKTGKKIWSYKAAGPVESPLSIDHGVLYIGSTVAVGEVGGIPDIQWDKGYVYAIDIKTGNQLWNYTTGSLVNSGPNFYSGVVYVGCCDGYVYALKVDGT